MRAVVLLCLIVAGCASSGDTQIYRGGIVGQRIVGNEVSVSVTNVWSQTHAFDLAEQHCRTHGRAARFAHFSNYTATFDCIPI